MHTLIFLCLRLESIHHDHDMGFLQVSLSLRPSAQQHYHIESLHLLGCTMTAAKGQKHDSGATQYELKILRCGI